MTRVPSEALPSLTTGKMMAESVNKVYAVAPIDFRMVNQQLDDLFLTIAQDFRFSDREVFSLRTQFNSLQGKLFRIPDPVADFPLKFVSIRTSFIQESMSGRYNVMIRTHRVEQALLEGERLSKQTAMRLLDGLFRSLEDIQIVDVFGNRTHFFPPTGKTPFYLSEVSFASEGSSQGVAASLGEAREFGLHWKWLLAGGAIVLGALSVWYLIQRN